jgi:hypothetical protein
VTVIDDRRAREYALARFRSMTPNRRSGPDQTAFRLLGLLPPDVDVEKELLDVLEEQAGGYYDPQTKSFYLLDDMPKDMTALLAAHEMTHALDDQRYDIDRQIAKVIDDDDASFALSAVIEGNATLVAARYVAKAVASKSLDLAQARRHGTNRAHGSLERDAVSPARPAPGTVRARRGISRSCDVDAAWTRLPRSSEQILHPREATGTHPSATSRSRSSFPSRREKLGKGWTRRFRRAGGADHRGACRSHPPRADALASGEAHWTNEAASGWGGDRFELWTQGEASIVLLATLWDTAKDAEEFQAALPRDRAAFAIRREGARVGIVAGAFGEKRDALLSSLVAP